MANDEDSSTIFGIKPVKTQTIGEENFKKQK